MESNFAKVSFKKAVELFQEWGFQVEDGPGHEEVTLILEGSDYRSYYVYEITRLQQIAVAALHVRQNNIGAHKDEAIFLTAASSGYQYPAPQRMLN